MSDYTTRASVTLNVNGKAAEEQLTRLKQRASDYKDAIAKASKEGNRLEQKKLRNELKATEREIKSIQSATMNVADVLKNLDAATPKELKLTLKQFNNELKNMERGTKAWNDHAEKIRRVKKELETVNNSLKRQQTGWQKLTGWLNKWQTMNVAGFAVVQEIVSFANKAVNAYAAMDSVMANTQKFTGMTREEVKKLNAEFKKIDTRTSIESLNELAASAGRLGKKSADDVMGFVRAGDIIGVAMNELGNDAPEIISKLAGIFNLEKEMGTEKAMLSVGSAINTLSQNYAAASPNLVDFSSRMGATASQTKMAMHEMLAFGTLLDANKVSMEKASTAMQGVISKMYAAPAEFAKKAGLDVNAFTESLKRSSTEGVMMFVDALAQMDQMQLNAVLRDLGTAGSGVTQTFQTLAGKSQHLKIVLSESADAFYKASSATEEFNIQNNTVQAHLDKAKKMFNELAVELGGKLMPLMLHAISGFSSLAILIKNIIDFCIEYKGVLIALAASIIAYNVAVEAATIKTKALAVCQGIVKGATVAWTAAASLSAATVSLLSGNVTRASAAFKLFSATLKLSPIGLLVGSITAVIGGLAIWISRTKEQTSLQKALNDVGKKASSAIAEEKANIESLLFVAENERLSMEKRIDAINKLNGIIPSYNAHIDETTGKYTASKKALDEYLSSLEKKIRFEANEQKLKELIIVQESAIAEREELELELDNERKALSSQPPQIHTSGHSATGASQLEIFETSADARRKAADKKVAQTTADVENFKFRMNTRIEKGEITPGYTKTEVEDSDDPKCSKCGNSPCTCISLLDDTNSGIYAAEKEWKAKEEALNRIAYATGEKNHEEYRKRMAEIDVEYYEKILANKSENDADYLRLQAEYQDALERKTDVAHDLSVESETVRYNDIVTGIKARYLNGLIPTQEAYNAALQQAELEHKRNLSLIYEEGTAERLQAERAYQDALIQDMEQRHKATEDAEKQHQTRLAEIKAEYFGDSPEQEKNKYDSDLALLTAVYEMELNAAGDNADERLRIEEAFESAKLILRKKYNQEAVEENRNTLACITEDFVDWLESDAGKAVMQSIDVVVSGMSAIFSSVSSLVQAELDVQTAAIEKRYEKEIEAAEGNEAKIKQLEEQRDKELAKAKNDANKKMYKLQVIQAVAQTAQNALAAYGSVVGTPFVGPVLAPIAAAAAIAAGAIQIATIKKQQQAAEAQGYASGGFTPKGNKYEPAGIVHKGEWVASQELLASPVVRPIIEALDYAQRTNTIGSIKSEDVSRTISAPSMIASSSPGTDVATAITVQAAALSNYADTIRKLNDRLSEPFVTVNSIAGDYGLEKIQSEYERLLRNKSSKTKR